MSESTWDDPKITAYVLGELSEQEQAAFESRLESDSELAAAVEEARSVTGQLQQLYASESIQTLDTERRHAIVSGELKETPQSPNPEQRSSESSNGSASSNGRASSGEPVIEPSEKSSSRSWRLPALALATAAALILLVGVAPWLKKVELETSVGQLHSEPSQTPNIGRSNLEATAESDEFYPVDQPMAEMEEEPASGKMVMGQELSREERIGDDASQLDAMKVTGGTSAPRHRASGDAKARRQVSSSEAIDGSMTESIVAQGDKSGVVTLERGLAAGAIANKQKNLESFSQREISSAQTPSPNESWVTPSNGPAPKIASRHEGASRPQMASGRQPGSKLAVPALDAVRTQAPSSEALPAEVPADDSPESSPSPHPMSLANGAQPASPGDVELESVDELGTIVLRGSRRDAVQVQAQVEAKLRELKESNEGADPFGRSYDVRFVEEPGQRVADRKKEVMDVAKAVPTPSRQPTPESVRRSVSLGKGLGGGGAVSRLSVRGRAALGLDADFALPIDEGRGPGIAGDRFEPITDNPFKRVAEHPLSTFSVDVDTASYSKTRDYLMRANQLPRPDAVRIEELLNYFDYEYDPPQSAEKHPFAANAEVTECPWNEQHRLARIALKGKTMQKDERPPCNLVFLLDTSGSMNAPNKLPLVIEGMQMLLKELNKEDKVAITVYAGSAGLVLDSTSAKKQKKIRNALTQLRAGGSTNGGAGIALAYQTARDNFITEGVNRVILCTDGDFNVGTTGTDELVRMVEKEAKGGIFLSVLGFGMGNHNDAMLEKVSGRGNGNYAFIDNRLEARKVLVDQTSGTLVTIAKDVKLQIEFNPKQVSSYRLIGYENRVLAKEDFNDDKKDAGEIGAGHAVTALYEIVPAGLEADAARPKVDDLKYQTELKPTKAAEKDEMLTLKLRYKQPDGDTSTLVEFPVSDDGGEFKDADHDVRFAAAVASFGMQLRRSDYAGSWTLSDALAVAEDSKGEDVDGLRAEFVELIRKASELMGQQ